MLPQFAATAAPGPAESTYSAAHADSIPSRRIASDGPRHPGSGGGMDGDPPVTGHATIRVSASVQLEARWDVPADAERGVVICHPHPLHRGTMHVPLLDALAADLNGRRVAVLRFNFRGVGRSTGSHDGGLAEIDDVAAAVEFAESQYPDLEFGIAGWSFGAAAALRWHARDRSPHNYVGISPGMGVNAGQRLPEPEELLPAHRTFIVGDRDQLVPVDLVVDYATRAKATIHVLKGSDHFFYFREQKVACLVAAGLGLPVPAEEIRQACA